MSVAEIKIEVCKYRYVIHGTVTILDFNDDHIVKVVQFYGVGTPKPKHLLYTRYCRSRSRSLIKINWPSQTEGTSFQTEAKVNSSTSIPKIS